MKIDYHTHAGRIELLYSALAEPLGIKFWAEDPEALQQQLYATRRKLKDPDLNALSFVPSPANPQYLWIVNRRRREPADHDDEIERPT